MGVQCSSIPSGATNLKIYNGASLIDNVTLDLSQKNNASAMPIYFTSVLTFSANTDYDVVFTGMPSNTTTFAVIDANAASSPPADVTALTYTNQSYVTGATPGSYTVTANATGGITLIPDSFVPTASTSVNAMTVQSGGSLTVQSGGALTIK